MQYFTMHTNILRRNAFCAASPTQQATWLKLLCACAEVENGGKITNSKNWSDREWLTF
jgi:hypothetical protein